MQWIYLKLQAMKLLKELDTYMFPAGQSAVTIFTNLDNRYYRDPEKEVIKA